MAKVKELLVTERELIERLSLITGHSKDVVRDVIKAQAEFVIDELSNGIPVRIGALGEFETFRSKCQGGYDQKEKKWREPKVVTRVRFKISKAVKRAVHDSENSY